jgi:tetratricopeptide (TPR) repeat protein
MRAIKTLLALLVPLLLAAPAAGQKGKFKKSEFKAAYVERLDRYARGDAQDAVAELVELEIRAAGLTESNLEPLWKAKLSAIRDLLRVGPELLVPVAQLHEKAYLAYLSRKEHALAAHSRALTVELAEIYAERVDGTRGRHFSSAVMTSMAGHLHAAFMDPLAANLYTRAAEIDPGNAAAHMGLAGIRERHGDYEAATTSLEALIATAPESAEGRLRLAVNLLRLGRSERAEGLLRRLVDSPALSPGWIYSLAVQELSRILVDRDDLEACTALLERVSSEIPGDPTLPILVAYVTDRGGRPSLKADLSESLRLGSAASEISPRYRYSQMPRQELGELRAELRGESAAQLAALAQALSGEPVVAAAGSR